MKTFDDNFEEACRNLFENAEFAPSSKLWNKIQNGVKSDNLWERTVRQLFDNAEITPSERVWQRIANTLHRPVIVPLWRWASAAAVALLVGSGIYYFAKTENVAHSSNGQQSSQEKKAETPQDLSEKGHAFAEKSSIASVPNSSEKEVLVSNIENANSVQETPKKVPAKQLFVPITQSESASGNTIISETDTRLIASPVGSTLLALPTQPESNFAIIKPVALSLAITPQEIISSETEIQAQYKYWVGVNIGLQDLKNNFQIAENLQGNPFLLQSELSKTDMRSAMLDSVQVQNAYSLGFEFARKFGKIFVVSTGLQHQNSEYTANVLLRQYTALAASAERTFASEMRVRQSSWGIPLLVGADWQNKNGFGLLLMAGLQADFNNPNQITNQFLNNQLPTRVEYDLGTYKKMNLAGLVRFGANYAISEHFNLGLEGSYRKALQNIYSSSHLESKPSFLGFSANLRYRF